MPRSSALFCLLLATLAAGGPQPAAAQGALGEGVARAEERVEAAGRAARERIDAVPVLGELADRIRISGSVLGVYWASESDSQVGRHSELWDARFFVDALVAKDVEAGGVRLARSLGASFEWNLYRNGDRPNDIGEAYVEVQGLGDSPWLNVQLGRFQIPVGESYLRFGKAWRDNPFISNVVGGPWWWDEGVRVHGADGRNRFGFVASWSNGESRRDFGAEGGDQATLKLWAKPTSWLHVSASALRGGRQGDEEYPARAALWLGETWGFAFGSASGLPSFHDGRPVPDAPGTLDHTSYVGAEAVLTHPRGARLWLSYGAWDLESDGPGLYDRRVHTWVAELVLEGRLVSPELTPFWLALRANGLGSYDRDEGYLLDIRWGQTFGFNMRSLDAYSIALGWRLTKWVTLRMEYTLQDVELVRGARSVLGGPADRTDYAGVAVGFQF
jgi:hypothetical protein